MPCVLMSMPGQLAPFASRRFAKFGLVGGLGIAVNLGCLWVLADALHMHDNLASALAIEVSIVSNFVLNDSWTFRDKREASRGLAVRLGRYHLVTGVGAVIQWVLFVAANYLWFRLVADASALTAYWGEVAGLAGILGHPVLDPPDVGAFKYLAQLLGIVAAVAWNFLVNLKWTWRNEKGGSPDQTPADARKTVPSPSNQ